MKLTRRMILVLIELPLLLAGLAGWMACQKPKPLAIVEQTPYLGMPQGITQLFAFDFNRLRTKDAFNRIWQELEKGDSRRLLATLRERVGFDPPKDIDLLYMGLSAGTEDPTQPLRYTIIIARGRFKDAESKLEPLRQFLGEEFLISPPEFKETGHASGIKKFQTKAQAQADETEVYDLNFAFPSDGLMVFAGTNDLLNSTLDVMTGGTTGLGQEEYWRKMLERPDIASSIWGAGNLNLGDESLQNLARLIPEAAELHLGKQFYYQMDLGEEFRAELGLICPTIDDASKFAAALKRVLGVMGTGMQFKFGAVAPLTAQLPAKLWIMPELETCKVSLKLSPEERHALINEWQKLSEQNAAPGIPGLPGSARPAAPGVPGAGAPPPAAPAPVQ